MFTVVFNKTSNRNNFHIHQIQLRGYSVRSIPTRIDGKDKFPSQWTGRALACQCAIQNAHTLELLDLLPKEKFDRYVRG